MVQVTMTGPEYAELLEKARLLDDLVGRYKSDRKFSVPENSVSPYSTGLFSSTFELPTWLQHVLIKDMEEQLLEMPETEFARLVKSDNTYYNILDKAFRSSVYSNSRGYVDITEVSKRVKTRWDSIKKRLDAGELVDQEVQDNG